MSIDMNNLRSLTYVRNDNFSYYDTVSKRGGRQDWDFPLSILKALKTSKPKRHRLEPLGIYGF